MKYSYKKTVKKLVMLFLFLPAVPAVVAQVPGTPYGLTALSPVTIPQGSGSFAGRTCFDVAKVNNSGECSGLASRQTETLTANGSRADFTNTITRNQTYTFTPSGTVSNVRFYFVEAASFNGQIIENLSGGNSGNNISTAVTCNIVYKSDLNSKASGKTNANALTVDIYAVYNNNGSGTGTDRSVKLTVAIRDCSCCGAYTTSGAWLQFMCYNLGADPTLTTPDQIKAASPSRTYGDFYQWGKKKAWPSSGNVSGWSSSLNTNISGAGGNQVDDAWGDGSSKTAADPCPPGWRIPSSGLFHDIFLANSRRWDGAASTRGTLIGNQLFFPAAGYRQYVGADVYNDGSEGYYWTSTPVGSEAKSEQPHFLTGELSQHRATACSVRCVAE